MRKVIVVDEAILIRQTLKMMQKNYRKEATIFGTIGFIVKPLLKFSK